MKLKLIILMVALLAVVALFSVFLAAPEVWPFASGTLKATRVRIAGRDFVLVDGEGMNQLGEIQSIALDFDADAKKIFVNRYIIHWNPFNKITVNNQFPVIYPIEGLRPGRYTMVYATRQGENVAGTVEVP